MRILLLSAGVLGAVMACGSAWAQSRDENWARCAADHIDPDLKIGACTAIIQSGQETTKNLAAAFYNRDIAYRDKGQYDRAIQDYDQAISLDPKYAHAFSSRGYANFDLARFGAAARDFEQSVAINGTDPYAALWLHLARARDGQEDTEEFKRNAAKLDLKAWPGPVVSFYLKQLTAQQVTEAARSGDEKTQREQGCGASFFVGEDALLRHATAEAIPLLRHGHETCPINFVEYAAAAAELKRLGE
jgi:lipoprotein NlpI